jgi:hypothetical protein
MADPITLIDQVYSASTSALVLYDFAPKDNAAGGGVSGVNGAGINFTLTWPTTDNISIRATNGQNYSPQVPAIGAADTLTGSIDARTNRLHWSENQQPEAVPQPNFMFVGDGQIYRIIPTRDALFVFASDGIYRVSGEAEIWRVDPFDKSTILAHRNAIDVHDQDIYAYTNSGLVLVNDGGVQRLTQNVIGDQLPGAVFEDSWEKMLAIDQMHRDVWYVEHPSPPSSTAWVLFLDAMRAKGHPVFARFEAENITAITYSPPFGRLAWGVPFSELAPTIRVPDSDEATDRQGNVLVDYQPWLGDDQPFSLKQFIDTTFLLDGVTGVLSLTSRYDSTDSTTATPTASTDETKVTTGVPRTAAIAPRLRPGVKASAASFAFPWRLLGISTRWDVLSEEVKR